MSILLQDMFWMSLPEFLQTWGLDEAETRLECRSGRLVARGRGQIRFYLPDMLKWLARTQKMPADIRDKVESAGDLQRLENWRKEQVWLCQVDYAQNTITLPDGSTLKDVSVQIPVRH